MKRFTALCTILVILTSLGLGGNVLQAEEDAPRRQPGAEEAPVVFGQQRAAGAVFVPMVSVARAPGNQPPAPNPPAPNPPLPAPRNAFFAIRGAKSYNGVTAVDRTGVHLAFYMSDEGLDEKQGQAAYYVFCPGDTATCADPGKWGTLIKFELTGSTRCRSCPRPTAARAC